LLLESARTGKIATASKPARPIAADRSVVALLRISANSMQVKQQRGKRQPYADKPNGKLTEQSGRLRVVNLELIARSDPP
jgi:hypothetical protein